MDEENPKIFLNDQGVIEQIWNGDLKWKSYTESLQRLLRLATELELQGKPVNVIVDFTHFGEVEPIGTTIAAIGLKDIPYRRIAGFGIKPEHQALLDKIKDDSRSNPGLIRDFPTREEALKWVEED
jgi:hypothetical protein